MEYLVEVHWTDPTARTVARILSTLPAEIEQATGDWPQGASRAFCVLRAENPEALDRVVHAINESGADARVITGAKNEARPSSG
jgi:hypothetical protein